MTGSNSIDDLFLKAAELSGSQRRKFLRTLPADIRAQVEKLLAADESVEGRGFLSKPIHREQSGREADAGGRRIRKQRTTQRPQQPGSAKAKKGGQRRGPAVGGVRPAAKSSRRKKSGASFSGKSGSRKTVRMVAAVAGVTLSVSLVALIMGELKGRLNPPVHGIAGEPSPETDNRQTPSASQPDAATADESSPLQAEERQSEIRTEFYTAAVNAPPLSERELKTLPKALHPASPVANPLTLPGVRAWSLETQGYRVWSNSVALSPDGRFAAVASGDGSIRIVNVRTGQFVKSITLMADPENGMQQAGHAGALCWSGNASALFVKDRGQLLKIGVSTGQVSHVLDGVAGRFAPAADYSSLYLVRHGKLAVTSAEDLSVLEEIPVDGAFQSVYLSPTGTYVLLAGRQNIALFENTRPLRLILEDSRDAASGHHVVGDSGQVVTGWGDGMIQVYDAAEPNEGPKTEYLAYSKGYRATHCWAWATNDVVLCTGTSETLDQYSIRENKFLVSDPVLRWHPPVAYDSERKSGIVGGGQLRMIEDGRPSRVLLEGDVSLMENLTFTPDGVELLISGFHSGRINLTTGERTTLTRTESLLNRFNTIVVSDTGQMIGCEDARIQVYLSDPPDRDAARTFDFMPAGIANAVWADDGRRVLARTIDGDVFDCRLDRDEPEPRRIAIAGGEKILDMLWNSMASAALLLTETRLLQWKPVTELVTELGEAPAGSRRMALNSAETHLAIAAPLTTVLETTGFSTVAEFSWRNAEPFWDVNDALLGISDHGKTMYRVHPATPEAVQEIAVPIDGYYGRRAFSISPVAPVAAAITTGNQIRFFDLRNGAHRGTLLPFQEEHVLLTPEGRIVGMSPGFQPHLVYQIRTDLGQETLTTAEFFRRFGEYMTP